MRTDLLKWVLAGLALAWCAPAPAHGPWPAIRPSSASFQVQVGPGQPPMRIEHMIRSVAGVPLYRFSCLAGTTAQLDTLGDADGENYVAPLVCWLAGADDRGVGALLAEDDAALWFTRGQVHADQLAGRCGRYPEFGRVRHFRLRGMRLTLAFRHVVVDRAGQLRTTLRLDAAADPGARSDHAARPGYLPPGPGCGHIRRGSEPRMCRAESGNWTECARIGR